jgi:prepilin-type N-terminal cleavage/methylation domain-containing protein
MEADSHACHRGLRFAETTLAPHRPTVSVLPENQLGINLADSGAGFVPLGRSKGRNVYKSVPQVKAHMARQIMNLSPENSKVGNAAGFSFPELLITITIIAIVGSLALISFRNSTKSFKLAGATRTLSTYLEKARVDSVRRHGGASMNINSATSYTVNIDFSGAGVVSARTVTLPAGTSLRYSLPPATAQIDPSTVPTTITYDWRGRPANAILLTVTDSTSGIGSSTVVVGPAGDISTDTTVTGPVTTPTPQTAVSPTSGIKNMRY